MILGVAAAAIGNELVQKHPTGHTFKSWLALMLGGPALFVAGRTLLEWVVFSRVSRPRLLGIAALLLLAVPLAFAPPLVVVAVWPWCCSRSPSPTHAGQPGSLLRHPRRRADHGRQTEDRHTS